MKEDDPQNPWLENGNIKIEITSRTLGSGVDDFCVDVFLKGTHHTRFYAYEKLGELTRQALESPERFKIRKDFLEEFVNRIESAFELKTEAATSDLPKEAEDLVECPKCGGEGRYSYPTKPDESYGCPMCRMSGRVTKKRSREYIKETNKYLKSLGRGLIEET